MYIKIINENNNGNNSENNVGNDVESSNESKNTDSLSGSDMDYKSQEKSIGGKNLPDTGIMQFSGIVFIIVLIIAIVAYIKYKRIS